MAGPRAADGADPLKGWKVSVNAEVADGRKGVLVCFGGRGGDSNTSRGKKILFHEILNRTSELASFCNRCYGKTLHYY